MLSAAIRRLPPAVLLLLAVVAGLGCGGGGNQKDARALLDKAFKHSIDSADMKLETQIQLKLKNASDRSLRVQASGPFRSNKGKLPSADIDVNADIGAGQPFRLGLLSTGDRAFVKFQDVYYERPRSEVARANRSLGRRPGRKSSLRDFGLDPHRWLGDARDKGDERVAGADTTHLSGKLDVSRVVRDLNGFVRRSGSAIGGATGQVPAPLTQSDLDKITRVVQDPSFDVYVAKSDNTIRRLAGHVDLKAPKGQASGRLEGGSLSFTIEFSKVNGNQRIQAPAKARPLSDLTRSLGTGLLGGGSGSGTTTPTPVPTGPNPGSAGYKRYAQCLDKANPKDTDAIQRCAELLR